MSNLTFKDLKKVASNIDADFFGRRDKEFLVEKLVDEAQELLDAVREHKNNPSPENKLSELKEFGDILYCLIACERQYGWDMRNGLSLTITKLQERKKFNII